MSTFYTRKGDDGTTGLLGEGRVPKYDLRLETLGSVDEATATLGLARALSRLPETQACLLQIQRHLYGLMGETAATPENAEKFHVIDAAAVEWLEQQTEATSKIVEIPRQFIVPGDTPAGAGIDLARTVVRRAERRMAELLQRGDVSNVHLLHYLNRLSSFLFVLELHEIQSDGKVGPTLAKVD